MLACAFLSLGFVLWTGKEYAQPSTPVQNTGHRAWEHPPESVIGDGVVAYYFHINVRCATCQAMEDYSRELILDRFGRNVVAGDLAWRPVNVQQPENRHSLSDFRALTRSLVLERRRDGESSEYKVLHDAWRHIYDRREFEEYLAMEIQRFLEAAE